MARPRATDEGEPSSVAFYEEHARTVRNALYRLCGERALDDLTQETFARAWGARDAFRGESSVRTWMYRIATRVAIDHLRSAARRPYDATLDEDRASAARDEAAGHVDRDLVRRGLARLSDDHRVVLVLHVMEGLTLDEVAGIVEAPVGTVKSRLYHARQGMREFLEGQGIRW